MTASPSQLLTLNKPQKTAQMAYFKEILTKSGIELQFDSTPHVLTHERSLAIRDLEKNLKSHMSYPNNGREFVRGLKILCDKETHLRKALTATVLNRVTKRHDGDVIHNSIADESLVKILLHINCLQDEIVQILLEIILKLATEEKEDTSLLRLLLNALRYLPYINKPDSLTVQLLDVLEVATYVVQLEILNVISEIIPDNQCESAAKQLIELLNSKSNLTAAIIDCLNSLNLSTETRAAVQEQILSDLLPISDLSTFPIFLEFILMDRKSQNLPNILLKSRNVLDKLIPTQVPDGDSLKVVVFSRLNLYASKVYFEGWINMISSIRIADHKPIDLLLLILLYRCNYKRAIETLFKKKIKTGFFKIPTLEAMLTKYCIPQILKDYFKPMLEIACNLIDTPATVEFAMVFCSLLFNHEHADRLQRQEMLQSLLFLMGDSKNASTIFAILQSFDFSKLQEHLASVMRILEFTNKFTLPQNEQAFDIIGSLAFGEKALECMSMYNDEIHLVIRKELTSFKKPVKCRAIISAVMVAKHLAITSDDQSNVTVSEDSNLSINDLPKKEIQEAASLLQLTNSCIEGHPEETGLYYDQLATVLMTTTNLDKHFLIWMKDSITLNFENTFVTEAVPEPINDLVLTSQFSLNSRDEIQTPISINIAEFAMKPQLARKGTILILAPLFRLMRLLHYYNNNSDLSTIDALLGCGIILPNVDEIDNFESDQTKQIADCIFHAINWFRELISAFISQRNRNLQTKIINRVKQLIELQELLEKCLENVPEHKLPVCYFSSVSTNAQLNSPHKIKVRGKKRPRKEDDANDTTTSVSTQSTKKSVTVKKRKVPIKQNFREMDTDTIILLKYPLNLKETFEFSSQITSQQIVLDIKMLKFLLSDFVAKLSILTNQAHSHFTIVKPKNLVTDCVQLLPNISAHFNKIVKLIQELQEKGDDELYTKQSFDIKFSFSLILQSFSLIFGWTGFQHMKNVMLLRDCLKALRTDQEVQLNSAHQLLKEFCNRLGDTTDQCLDLPTAVNLLQTTKNLYSINTNPDVKKKIITISGQFLGKKWCDFKGNDETSKTGLIHLNFLIKTYLDGTNVKTLNGLVGTLQTQAELLKLRGDSLPMFNSITKASFYLFFRELCSRLLEAVRNEVASLTNNAHLILWRNVASTMQGLMTIVKIQDLRSNLVSFLKQSVGILKLFLTQGIPILEITLKSKPDEVVEILKVIQISTRFLHHLCCHSKVTKDSSLVAYVPQFRSVLESLVYRVKAALVANNCSAAFWMGTLKNRDLQGEDITSQSTTSSEDADNEKIVTDEELLPDDESDEADNGSVSDIF